MPGTETLSVHPEHRRDAAPNTVITTLYDVMATLQTVTAPEDDEVVVAGVAEWLRSGHLRFVRHASIAV